MSGHPSRGRTSILGGWVSVLIFTLVGVGCGSGNSQTLTIYNGQHPQLTQALVNAFEKQTGITVNLRTDDSIVLAQQIIEEGSASPADVFIAENSPELMLLQQHDLFSALPASILSQVPSQDNSPSGDWVGMAARVSALAYNTGDISANQLPKSVLDLADPQWAGKIAISPSDSDFVPVVAAVIDTRGTNAARAWLEGLKRNATTYQDIETVLSTVNRGDLPVGMINSYYWFRLQLEVGNSGMHSKIYYFPPHDPGGVENISGAAILASSQHQRNAQKFLAFLVSEQGQQILASGDDFEYPVRPGVAPNSVLPSLSSIQPTFIGIAQLGDDQAAAQLLQQVGLE
jgi:iron(III) transport system substrate-binding protein